MSEALKVYEQLCKDKHIEHNIKQKDLVIELDKFLLGSSRNFIKKLSVQLIILMKSLKITFFIVIIKKTKQKLSCWGNKKNHTRRS